MYRMIKHG